MYNPNLMTVGQGVLSGKWEKIPNKRTTLKTRFSIIDTFLKTFHDLR